MPTFTVHLPPDVVDDGIRAERTVFVRDGFDWGAFLFGPLGLLYRGLWRATLAWAVAAAALFAVAVAFGLGGLRPLAGPVPASPGPKASRRRSVIGLFPAARARP